MPKCLIKFPEIAYLYSEKDSKLHPEKIWKAKERKGRREVGQEWQEGNQTEHGRGGERKRMKENEREGSEGQGSGRR